VQDCSRNADLLVREKVDLAIEVQTDETVAPIVAAMYLEGGIGVIASIPERLIMARIIMKLG
jgi:ribose transport system substrate-binding protein